MIKLPKTKIHVFSIMWNEQVMLPYFLRHYSLFADKIFIINDHSTDKTVEIARKNPKVTILNLGYAGGLNEDNFNKSFEKNYKKHSRGSADWIMCVDADELIYHPDLIGQLDKQRQNGVKIIRTTGFTMISKKLPTTKGQIYSQLRQGIRTREYDKPVVFDPSLNIHFTHGRHNIKNLNITRPVKAKLVLLHYKYLSKSYFLKRTTGMFKRTPSQLKYADYRIERGLKFYEEAIKENLTKVV